jgi:hypothetical protein
VNVYFRSTRFLRRAYKARTRLKVIHLLTRRSLADSELRLGRCRKHAFGWKQELQPSFSPDTGSLSPSRETPFEEFSGLEEPKKRSSSQGSIRSSRTKDSLEVMRWYYHYLLVASIRQDSSQIRDYYHCSCTIPGFTQRNTKRPNEIPYSNIQNGSVHAEP